MNSALILSHVAQYVQLSGPETATLESVLITRPFKQGELIIKSGDLARYMLFVNAGYIMTYYTDKHGDDHVVQFAANGWWCGDMSSLSSNPHTPYSTKGLSDGEVLLLPKLAHEHLLEKHGTFERYFRLMFQSSFMKQQTRFLEAYSNTAEERYQTFLLKYPGMEQYVPQKYIASYLGMTPEFLSKIRKKALGK